MAKITQMPKDLTNRDIRFNWNYQRWGLYHNALIEIQALIKNDTSVLTKKINRVIDENRKEMADYDRFFVAAFGDLDLAGTGGLGNL